MNCTPETCPHRALMENARAACLSCDHADPSGHGVAVSDDAAGERAVGREATSIETPRGRVAPLPPDVEERTAELYRRWCGLDTIDALLMLHVCNGGTTATFGAYLDKVREAILRMDLARDSYRATAWAKWKRLVMRFVPFLRGRLRLPEKGKGGAKLDLPRHYVRRADAEAAR